MSGDDLLPDFVTAIEPDAQRVPSAQSDSIARISVLFGPNAGRTYKVTDECTIGRSQQAGVFLPDRGVSRLHARLRRLPGNRFLLEDLSSRNGTLVDGNRISSAEIGSGARIQLGPRCLLLLSVHDRLEDSLLQTRKMEIIGRLSAGINHDFNNLLCVVLANAAYLLELPPGITLAHSEVRECLEDMRSAAQAGAELTGRLATLVQGGPFVRESVDISTLCDEVAAVLRDTLPRGVRIESRVQPGIHVFGVRAHLFQLLLNPALNARDAMPDGGTLSLELVREAEDDFDDPPHVYAESYAVITFRDTGCGMSSEVLNSAFEPFFTTKEIDLGRGLGLATVRKVASEHGGTVELSSQLNAGTTLRIVLPLNDAPSEDAALDATPWKADADGTGTSSEAGATLGNNTHQESLATAEATVHARAPMTRRVLVAESDRALARVFGKALRSAGFDVLWAPDYARALVLFEEHGQRIDVMLLDRDILDPGLRKLQATVAARRPELPVVVLTDGSEPAGSTQSGSAPAETLLRKPIDPKMLARVLAQAVRRRGSKP